MEFKLSKEQELIQKTAREFAENRIEPLVFQIDRENRIPDDIVRELGELELTGIPFPEEYGGAGAGYLSYALVVEQISRISGGVATLIKVNNLALTSINNFGTPEQKMKWLPDACKGKKFASFAFTEPGTGSDPKMITTTAKKDGDYYIINGTKRFISNAELPGPMVVMATDDESGYPSAFIIEKFYPGYSISEPWDKIGQRGGHTYDVYLKDVRVSIADMLGEKGQGYSVLIQNVGYGKVGISAAALGTAQGALEESIKYAKEKMKRDKPIANFPTMQARLADMAAKVEASRWLTYRLGYLADTLTDRYQLAKEAALTKLFVTESTGDVVREAIQVHGSYGVMKDYKAELFYRDSIINEIIEGSADLQRMIIAGNILR